MRKPSLALLCAIAFATAAPAQEHDRLLPDSTAVYVSIENLARTRERFENSPLEALWNDEKVQAFFEKPLKSWAELREKMKNEQGFAFDEILGAVGGQAAIGIGGSNENAQIAILVDIGENEEKVRDLVMRAERPLVEDEGYTREENDFRGVTITSYTKEDEEDGEADRFHWCIREKLFVIGNRVEPVRQVLIRAEGDAGTSLADREVYQKARARLGGRTDLFFYVDGASMLKMFTADEQDEEDAPTWAIVRALGIGSIEAIGGQFSLKPKSVDFRLFMPVGGKKEGILKLFDGKNSALTPPRYVPPDADLAGAVSLDISAIWQEARKVMDRIQPGLTAGLDAQLDVIKQQTGVDIQADIIGALGEELSYYVKMPEQQGPAAPAAGVSVGMFLPNFVMALQLKDKQRFEAAMTNLLAQVGPLVAAQDYLGVKMYVIHAPLPVAPAFAIMPDRLVFGMRSEDVKEVISRYGKDVKSLLDSEAYQAALGELPAERMTVAVSDEARTARQGLVGAFMAGMAVAGAADMNLFPDAKVFEKYLGITTTCMVNEDDGISYSHIIRLKEQKKQED